MPFIGTNGCQIYYESFGTDSARDLPIVLIHGSTQSGYSCWRRVTPLLAEQYRVIVPDCRGHGSSENPTGTYRFYEMAADIAGLIRALGYQTAHIIGHSNGGNVALVTLVEFPEVVQTAVLQAANAWVSPDLVEKEPRLFDPERVDREAPAWRDEMIALHSQLHGRDYWRTLLQMTVQEIISEPNYTPTDLAKVERACLVIQGENDRVNAPQRHAQFIAANIPFAEIWTPPQTGHSVHEERLFEWLEHVLDFLNRRGDSANEALYRLKLSRFYDGRETVFTVQARQSGNEANDVSARVELSGKVLTADQHRAALESLPGEIKPGVIDTIKVLLEDETPWALASRPISDLRAGPGRRYERLSQVLLGEPVRILESAEGWSRVRQENDRYLGWISAAALQPVEAEAVWDYRSGCNAVVQAELLPAYTAPDNRMSAGSGLQQISQIPFGVYLWVTEWGQEYSSVRLPNNRHWLVASAGLSPLLKQPHLNEANIKAALHLFDRFVGVPYLWGGRTPFGFDCSGLAQAFLSFLGIQIPRDADQQYRAGIPVADAARPGDLLYFGEPSADDPIRFEHVSHVGISLGGLEIIHANGAAGGVSYNSLDPASPIFSPWLKDNLLGIRRWV